MPDLPRPDLGLPFRYSRKANETVGEALKATYIMGAADGYSVGQTVGYGAGHLVGVVEASVATGIAAGIIFVAGFLLLRLLRTANPR